MLKKVLTLIVDDTIAYWNIDIIQMLFSEYVDINYIDVASLADASCIDLGDLALTINEDVYSRLKKLTVKESDCISKAIFTVSNFAAENLTEMTEYDSYYMKCLNVIREEIIEKRGRGCQKDAYMMHSDEVLDVGKLEKLYLSFKTIVEIIVKLELIFLIDETELQKYKKSIYVRDTTVEQLYHMNKDLKNRIETMIRFMRRGVIEIDADLNIITINNVVEKLFRTKKSDILNTNLRLWLSQVDIDYFIKNRMQVKDKLIEYDGSRYALSVRLVINEMDEIIGANIVVESLADVEDIYIALRGQMFKQGYIAKYTIDNIKGESSATVNLKKIIENMALSDSSVLITGETGTGKEIVAQALHNLSSRKDKPFLAINCIALPENLLESELFGYEEGAFTGAKKGGKKGVFELANGGTVFFDEIGKMPVSLQGKLLRVIQEREIMPIGGSKIINIDVRLIFATNRNISELIEEGSFLNDLYYRINVLPIKIPALRERKEDINILIKHFSELNKYNFTLDDEAKFIINNYMWPGNIRELLNCMEYLDYLRKRIIYAEDLPPYLCEGGIYEPAVVSGTADKNNIFYEYNLDEVMVSLCQVLLTAYNKSRRMGRKTIVNEIRRSGVFVTEQQLRKYTDMLRQNKIIIVENKGGGTRLSSNGKLEVENWLH